MKKLLGLIFNAWVLAILGLLAIAVLIWYVGPMIGIGEARPLDSELVRVIVIVVIILLYALHKLWQAWAARRQNSTVVNRLLADAPASAKGDAASAELAVINERFQKALQTLRKARFGNQRGLWSSASARVGQRYLYELPWYVIIGAPGSGKTTALLNAGLEFPLAASMGEAAVRGVGGTRHCDWWFTNQAVMIDTAGRYTTQDSDRDTDHKAWNGFLGMIKKSRPRQPVNGVLVTVSVPDLLTRSAAARAEHAAAVRARVQELHEQLGIRFPIYLLVSKCDLLAGFMDYLGDANKETRQDPWGFTFALDARQHTDVRTLPHEFDLLQARLTDGLIDRLQSERDPARRARIYGFPQQFAGLGGVLKEFVDQVFSPSQFEERPLLRGVYFISGTQEGTPIDRMLGAIARTYRLARTPLPSNQATGKSFFLSRLLQEVVFKEAELAGTNLRWERRRAWLAAGGYTLIGAVFVATAGAWTVSYLKNRQVVADVSAKVDTVRALVQAKPKQASSDLPELLPALAATQALAVAEQGSVPWSMGFGLYQGRKLDSATQQVYKHMLMDAVQPRIALRVEEQLKSSFDNPELQYEVLKAYMMLQDPEHFDAKALKLFVTLDWEVNLPRDVTIEQRAALASHLDALLAQRATVSPLPEGKALVEKVRAKLALVPLAQRVYNRIRREGVGPDIPEFSIAKAAGPSAALVFARTSGESITRGVPGLYTFDGYHKGFQSVVEEATEQLRDEEGWVLGRPEADRSAVLRDPRALGRLTDEVRRAYLTDYAKHWETYIADIRMLPMASQAETVQMSRILSAPDSPLALLMRALVKQTTLVVVGPKTVVDRAEDKATEVLKKSEDRLRQMLGDKQAPAPAPAARIESLVDDRFVALRQFVNPGAAGGPAPLDGALALINEVYAFLIASEAAAQSNGLPPPSDVPNKVKADAPRMPEPARSLLSTLARSGKATTDDAVRRNLSQAVNAEIGVFCQKAIPGRYPFSRTSETDVTQADFARLFSPGGLFDSFFKKNLAEHVDTSTRQWSFHQLGKDSGGLAQFQRAAVIRDTFFHGGAGASLPLVFKPQAMDDTITQFTLDFDGQLVKYAHGPQIPAAVQWPGPKGSAQVRITLQPALAGGTSGLVTEGPWALFRMFDKMQIVPSARPERFNVIFNVDNRKATFEVTADSVVNPFKLRELAEFGCPSSI